MDQVLAILNKNHQVAKQVGDYPLYSFDITVEDQTFPFLYFKNDNPDELTFILPNVCTYDDDHFPAAMNAMNYVNEHMHSVKCIVQNETDISIYFDHTLFGGKVTLPMIQHICAQLFKAGWTLLDKIDEFHKDFTK